MIVTIAFDIQIEGDLTEDEAKKIFFENVDMHAILSEQVDGTEKWAILVDGWDFVDDCELPE